MLRFRTVLVPTDFSSAADQALSVAHSLARDHEARLVIMSAVVPPAISEASLPDREMAGLVAGVQQQLETEAARFTDLPIETHAVLGDAGSAVVAAARKYQADLIVMGTQGRSGITRMLLGSVAEHVLRHAPCPVLTIKPGTETHLQHQ